MGLATVQGIVVQHGGIIKVISVPGQGATFNLYFPIIANTQTTAEPSAARKAVAKGTEQILFVDDDQMLAKLGERLLSELGYQVTTMTDSREALEIFTANAERFDLVITDQTMPHLSGKDLIQVLKKVRPDIPTILCTGYSTKINEEDAKRLGISAFMMKPMDLPALGKTVRQVLDGKRAV
jgi:DNA-binding NtrC family response regulator